MKSIIVILIVLIFQTSNSQISEELELGIRFTKLANTYRESGDFMLAAKYLDEAYNYVNPRSMYWTAVCHEYYALLYRDLAKIQTEPNNSNYYSSLSGSHFDEAQQLYNKCVKMENGSQVAISKYGQSNKQNKDKKTNTMKDNFVGAVDNINSLNGTFNNEINSTSNKESITNKFDFADSKYKELPSNLPIDMDRISLANNKFAQFPNDLLNYKKLEYINLSNNKIKSIPANIGDLKKLTYLNLSNNKIKELPDGLNLPEKIEILDLENNKLKSIPFSLCNYKSLKTIKLKGNKIPFKELKALIQCMPNTLIETDNFNPEDNTMEESFEYTDEE